MYKCFCLLFRQQRWLSAPLFDRVALRFSRDWRQFNPQELVSVIRPFGQLNYRPSSAQLENELYTALDCALRERFNQLSVPMVLDLLIACAYIERFPVNFMPQIFSPTFITKVQGNIVNYTFNFLHIHKMFLSILSFIHYSLFMLVFIILTNSFLLEIDIHIINMHLH